ncbi:MAG: TetR/AcrR family transcriptional regulator [Pseudomonadota bacterium]
MKTIRLSTRDALMEASFELLSRNPGASLAEIAEAAGVGRATLHRYFSTRDELLRSLALTAIAEMDAAAEGATHDAETYGEALRATLEVVIPLSTRHGFLANEPISDDPELTREYARQDEEVRELIDGAKSEGVFDPTVSTTWIVQAYEYLLYAAWESVNEGEATPSQAANLAWRTLTAGLGASA